MLPVLLYFPPHSMWEVLCPCGADVCEWGACHPGWWLVHAYGHQSKLSSGAPEAPTRLAVKKANPERVVVEVHSFLFCCFLRCSALSNFVKRCFFSACSVSSPILSATVAFFHCFLNEISTVPLSPPEIKIGSLSLTYSVESRAVLIKLACSSRCIPVVGSWVQFHFAFCV